MSLLDSSAKLGSFLDKWKEVNQSQQSPVEILDDISTLLETEAAALNLLDPDPFDERQSVQEENVLGHLFKTLTDYENDEFIRKLTLSYMFNSQNDFELNCASARLLINLMPTLPDHEIYTDLDVGVNKLLQWAKDEKEPLRTYSCAMLIYAMKLPACPGKYMDQIAALIPMLIKRLHYLSRIHDLNAPCVEEFDYERIENNIQSKKNLKRSDSCKSKDLSNSTSKLSLSSRKRKHNNFNTPRPTKQFQYDKPIMNLKPLSVGKQQDLILRYLHPISEYQELLPVAFELDVLDLLFCYIDHHHQKDPQLACSALLYLASLLCHKKFIVEFINCHGIEKILNIPQPSPVATMSSLCLYYMVYNEGNEDCVERICLRQQSTLQRLVEYLLWLLECSHISGRCHSTLFFSLTFPFRAILHLFDSMDGLRKVVNLISTLKIMRVNESDLSTDDDVYMDYEVAKNACLTLKKYFEVHVTMISNDYKNQESRQLPNDEVPEYKSMVITPESLQESVNCIIKYSGQGTNNLHEKQIIKRIISLEIPQLLLQLISMTADRKNYNNRFELFVVALDTLLAISAFKEIALAFCQQVHVSASEKNPGIRILLSAVEGKLGSDIQVRKAALKVVCNCVTSKKSLMDGKALNGKYHRTVSSIMQSKVLSDMKNNLIQKIWSAFRNNNAIMILLELLKIDSPITEADSMRALVCKTLYGLSENELICQILGKLPIFHDEQLMNLMRTPILSDRINEHVRFCNYASLLLERVTGKPSKRDFNTSKAGIISQTRITYSQKELLFVIYHHLKKQGLEIAAQALKDESNLSIEEKPSRESIAPGTPYLGRDITRDLERYTQYVTGLSQTPVSVRSRRESHGIPPHSSKRMNSAAANGLSPFQSPQTERKILFTPKRRLSSTTSSPNIAIAPAASSSFLQSPILPTTRDRTQMEEKLRALQRHRSSTPPPPTLDNIVTSYLREQHAKCANPVATCPPFSLFRPHNCPKPKYRHNASMNITKRLFDRQRQPPFGGKLGRKHNRQFIHSRFRSGMVYKSSEEDYCIYSVCSWVSDTGSLALGTVSGDLKIINFMGQDELFHHVHDQTVVSIDVTKDCKLVATSADYGQTTAAVWGIVPNITERTISLESKFELAEDFYLKFSNSQERVIGTNDVTAHVYNVGSGQLIGTYYDESNANNYLKNVACFGPCDDLLLNDGCLWDVRAKKLIHKFDKFNDIVSGVFHPSGREIVINAEVWDVRTFRLLDTYPALENCQITFNNLGDVMYATKYNKKNYYDGGKLLGPYESSFRTFDAFDYSAIGTVDVKKNILSICPDPYDQILAVIEDDSTTTRYDYDTSCRLYNVGRTKGYGEEESDEEQDEDSEQTHSSGDAQDSSVDLMNLLEMLGDPDGENDGEMDAIDEDDEDEEDEDDGNDDGWIDVDDDSDDEY